VKRNTKRTTMTVIATAAAHRTRSLAGVADSSSTTPGNWRPIRMKSRASSRKTMTSQNDQAWMRVFGENNSGACQAR
jgi:hypothetical protein